jgi:serine/threonine protein kinase
MIVKLADLGSCRGIHSKGPFTEYIATRWYRSPETLLTSGKYNFKMDMWGAGCVLYETVTRYFDVFPLPSPEDHA